MTKLYAFVIAPLVLTVTVATAWGQTSGGLKRYSSMVVATLHAILWRPQAADRSPASC